MNLKEVADDAVQLHGKCRKSSASDAPSWMRLTTEVSMTAISIISQIFIRLSWVNVSKGDEVLR